MENYLYKLLYYKNRISYFTISRKFIRKLYTFPIFLISTFQYFLYLLQHFDTYLKLYKSKSMILISVSIKIPKSRYKIFFNKQSIHFLVAKESSKRNHPNPTNRNLVTKATTEGTTSLFISSYFSAWSATNQLATSLIRSRL